MYFSEGGKKSSSKFTPEEGAKNPWSKPKKNCSNGRFWVPASRVKKNLFFFFAKIFDLTLVVLRKPEFFTLEKCI